MKIEWYTCKGIGWCELFRLDIEHKYVSEIEGVYVVWTGSGMDNSRKIVAVGAGMIKEEFNYLRTLAPLKEILAKDTVFTTWAEAPSYRLDRIYAYLYKNLKPSIKDPQLTDAKPKKVNLPWEDEIALKTSGQMIPMQDSLDNDGGFGDMGSDGTDVSLPNELS